MNQLSDVDVAIVGGGFSGLAAAMRLHKAGIKVLVLEARGRVGGRNWDPQYPDGRTVVLGSQWISKHQARMWSLGQEFGLTRFEPSQGGDMLIESQKGFVRATPEIEEDEELMSVLKELESMAETVPLDSPWLAPNALEWDSQTFYSWLKERVSPELVEMITPALCDFMSVPQDYSLLHALFYTRANGGITGFLGIGDHAHDTHIFAEGAQRINEGMSAKLGDRVRLNSVVHTIAQNDKNVRIEGTDFSLVAENIIIAMSPAMTSSIRYEPSLPAARNLIVQRAVSGRTFKIDVMYKKPFWREMGLSGYVEFNGGSTIDLSPPNEQWGGLSMLIIEHGYGLNIINMPHKERKEYILSALASAFGEQDHKNQFISYHEYDWESDDFTRGCVTVFAPGGWTAYGHALREPVGRIHWAGSETSTEFPGQMEGAVRAGERAADEVLVRLKNKSA